MQAIKVAVDAVVFGYKEKELYLLLIKRKYATHQNQWALPGGFVHTDEALTDAVQRELQEETGITVNYLEQLYTFGDQLDRDPRGRVISIAYFGLVNPEKLTLMAATDAQEAKWFPMSRIPELAFDHEVIVQKAKERLHAKVHYQPIGFDLLNKEFPFSDVEQLYQAILQKKIDRRNFRKKLLSFGFLQETDKIHSEGSGRPAKLFTFNKDKYQQLEKEGFYFEIKFA
ncbi:NUDIX hydrolase [Algivirga pacifica]|uniref:NUDIX domain-containing protein n=1 Tax=Algivirga pacifica TaxID=1162670 RepID=A0ABP9DCB7_9BACT